MSITFQNQKNGEKADCITQHRSPNPNSICPVQAWAALIHRILQYPDASEDLTVNTVLIQGKRQRITSDQTRRFIHSHVRLIGEEALGIRADDVGTHSLCSSCTMLLYLANIRTSSIMLIGRWKSDAFMLYLRKQVKEFTQEVVQQMTNQPDPFFTIPNLDTEGIPGQLLSDRDDPRTPHPESLSSFPRFHGQNSTETTNMNHTGNTNFHVWG